MSRLLISAAHKSSGKTTITLGLCAALSRRGMAVQPFKKGPDYIDPLWLSMAADRTCFNLDFYTQSHEEILTTYARAARDADISIVEGNKGLYDGTDLEGSNSSAALASLLGTPIVLVIDTQGITRSVAPLLLGFQSFDRDINIAGVILNKVGGSRHESKLRAVIERYTDIPVLGAVQRDPQLEIKERHLGLIPSNELSQASQTISTIADHIAKQVELDKLLDIARQARPLPDNFSDTQTATAALDIKLGIARDAAFGFYYPDDLAALSAAGAKLVNIDTLQDSHLPEIDGLFIGGGFPETHMKQLEANVSLRREIRQAIENGMPVYAECGGLMYLARKICWHDEQAEMVGIIPADVIMHNRPVGRGYTLLEETDHLPWRHANGEPIHAHEFHYSELRGLSNTAQFAYRVLRGTGIQHGMDGYVYKNLVATYTHQRHVRKSPWATRFIEFVRQTRHSTQHRHQKLGV
ncbi:MAG: cobyrinate a,c-diamide synthase [Gammaproteobacteria bacterium]|nr:cobyrinate a,c-diamide synthase [Gammaproteobacteria bacterium]